MSAARRGGGGGGLYHLCMASVLNKRFSSRSVTVCFCFRATVFTSISTGDPISFLRSRPPSRKLSSGKSLRKGLGTVRTQRGEPWGSGAARPSPPPLGGVINDICRPGDNRGVWPGLRLVEPPVASIGGRLSITGGRPLPVCHYTTRWSWM